MIEKLLLENFQRHERLDVKLDRGITTLVGPSDAGKSAVIRALRWLALNRPRGDSFVMFGRDFARVRVKTDGKVAVRERGKKLNGYRLDKAEFRAFRDDVPQSIAALLGLSDLNFQGQHDAPFWFGLSPPELARKLNEVVDLELIDRVAERLASRLRSVRAEAEVVDRRLEQAKQGLKELAFVPVAAKDLKWLEELKRRSDHLVEKFTDLNGMVREANKWTEEQGRKRKLSGLGQEASLAGGIVVGLSRKVGLLRELIDDIDAEKAKASGSLPGLSELRRSESVGVKIAKEASQLAGAIITVRTTRDNLRKLLDELAAAEEKLKKETGGRCPLCGGPMV